MKEFGRNEFEKTAYLNFESSERLKSIFAADFDIRRIISVIEIEVGTKVKAKKPCSS